MCGQAHTSHPPQVRIQESPAAVPSCVPADAISQAAYKHAALYLHPDILAHSIRVFLYAKAIAEKEQARTQLPLLFTACVFHDLGTSEEYNTRPLRFEIEGADAARNFLTAVDFSVPESDVQEVWNAIALHTAPQIAERIPGLVRLVRLAVIADFKNPVGGAEVDENLVVEAEKQFGRGDIEKVLGDAVAEQAIDNRGKAPSASWPGELLRAKLAEPEWEGVNKGF